MKVLLSIKYLTKIHDSYYEEEEELERKWLQ